MTDSLSIIHHLIDGGAKTPADPAEQVYRSGNGDVWQLVRASPAGPASVRHTANAASGGAVSELSVEEFLAINGSGPEHGALRILLGRVPKG